MTPDEAAAIRERNRAQHARQRANLTPEEHERELQQRRLQRQGEPADVDSRARFRSNNGLHYCLNADDTLIRAYRMREEIGKYF